MNSLVVFLVVLGVFLPSTLGLQDYCPGNGDGAVDWTKGNSTWYYCQTGRPNCIFSNCYVRFTEGEKEGETNVEVHTYAYARFNAQGIETFRMKRLGPGKYEYPSIGTTAKILKVSADGNCLTYWKCTENEGKWNGMEGYGAYLMVMCNKPHLCKRNGDYDADKQKMINEAKKSKNVVLFDIDQAICEQLNVRPQSYV